MKNKSKAQIKKSTLAVMAIVIAAVFQAGTVFALGQVTITVKNPDPFLGNHSQFIYDKEPGSVIEDIASIKNFSDEVSTVKIYAVDATTTESGNFILTFKDDKQEWIGQWTEISTDTITLNPKESVDIPFKITLPEKATPGQYLGGIVIEESSDKGIETDGSEREKGTSVSVQTRIGARVYLTIPGEIIEDIKLANVEVVKDIRAVTKFYFTIENNGNVSYTPYARINIYDTVGNLYETIEQQLGTSPPHSVIKPSIKMKKRPIIGNFTADIDITYERSFMNTELHGTPLSESTQIKFMAMPWFLIFIGALILFLIIGANTCRKIIRSSYLENSVEYKIQHGEDLISLAESRDLSWRKLAKYNKIKAPYIIKEGDIIKVPKKMRPEIGENNQNTDTKNPQEKNEK